MGFAPTVNLMTGPHTVTSNIGAFAVPPNTAAVTAAMTNGSFNTFAPALEGIHNLQARSFFQQIVSTKFR